MFWVLKNKDLFCDIVLLQNRSASKSTLVTEVKRNPLFDFFFAPLGEKILKQTNKRYIGEEDINIHSQRDKL